jgi:hypothetical protein
LAALAAAILFFSAMPSLFGGELPAPALTVKSGSAGATIATDTARPWKRYLAIAGSDGRSWTLVAAEHGSGDDGGLWLYHVHITPYGEPTPAPPINPPGPPPAPDDLPLAELRAIKPQGLPADEAQKLAAVYAALADQIGSDIKTPQQLLLATKTQYLAIFTAPGRLDAWKTWIAPVHAWIDAQQTAGKLAGDKLDRYATVYRALAEILRAVKAADSVPWQPIPIRSEPCNCPGGVCPSERPKDKTDGKSEKIQQQPVYRFDARRRGR